MSTEEQPATWDEFGWGPWPVTTVVPHGPLTAAEREEAELPASLTVVSGEGVVQHPVFDPSLKDYGKAVRAGEPQFSSPDTAALWHDARRRAVDHVLAAIASSRWADHLVLRGSVLLRAWYGPAAREPGDLDFVVVPATWAMEEPRTERMLDELASTAEAASEGADHVRIDAAGALRDEIWTYDRVPGRRLVLPWHAEGLPSGSVQLDFVFEEQLPTTPELTHVPRWNQQGAHQLLAATPELSLAWKLLWLMSDIYPQGKDLYDAVLLAESTPLRASVLMETLVASDTGWTGRRVTPDLLEAENVDADEFRKDYPDIHETVEGLHERLLTALEATFAECAAIPPTDGYTWRARLLAPRIEVCRELARREGMEAVQEYLRDHSIALTDGIVVIREAVGPDRCSVEGAAATYTDFLDRSSHSTYYERNPDATAKAITALRELV
ncbi:MAG TPA: nucleotidyl transferase AbiEii/AbiGii toxin family protein [Yinghuangia sp.]|uniref:nucleotidyl transferase AbiEii/AbiGii toxin family protein n=1 Tax=Yinghuangia sp. YIM S10712 TaxID=3436930 RepID=UPI002BF15FA8|nr:nucleotidyl transferase AbiEii/AbiGii toxin family protein [Yinghuangia sp.]